MYGIIISTAILISSLTAEKVAKRQEKNTETLWGGLIVIIIGGVIGARIYHVIDYWNHYRNYLVQIPAFWRGGLGIYGGIFGGVFSFILYLRIKRERILTWLDIAGLVMPLGQALGRWGNFFNKELLPFAIYESFFDFVLFLILLTLWKRKMYEIKGVTFFTYLMGYGLIRFFLEFLKEGSWEAYGVNIAQGISLGLIITSIIVIYYRCKKARDELFLTST